MNAIGLDVGTTTLSAVAVDANTGATRATLTLDSLSAIAGRPWENLQCPGTIVERALDMVSQLSLLHGPIHAIGLTGQMHGIVYLNASGEAVGPLYTWQDARCDEPVRGADLAWGAHESYAARLARLTGYPMATGYGAATHYWHVENKCVPEGAVRFCAIHDYVGMKLTGRKTPLTHASDAASFGLFDRAACAFDEAAARRAGIDVSFFPEVARGAQRLGHTAGGVPVSVAIGDNQAGFIGAVREPDKSVMVSVGTSGQVSMTGVAAEPGDGFEPGGGFEPRDGFEPRPLNGDDAILVGSTLCGGRAYAQLERFFRTVFALAGGEAGDLYPAMNELGLKALALTDKLTVDTRFAGTRRQPDARGSVTGIGTHNLTAAHLIGGVLEGIVEELHALYRAMLDAGAARRTALIGAGNAIRRNPALVRAFENAFGMRMLVPAHSEETAYGAALFGMAAAGLCTLAQAQSLIAYEPRA